MMTLYDEMDWRERATIIILCSGFIGGLIVLVVDRRIVSYGLLLVLVLAVAFMIWIYNILWGDE